jgi:hypothetical protein
MSDCALQQALHGSGHLRAEDTSNFLLMLPSESDHFIKKSGRRLPSIAAEQAP